MSTPKGPDARRAAGREGEAGRGSQILQPSGWPTPKGYANGMAADGRLVVTGGVIGWDIEEHLADGFVAQVRQTLSNIAAILAEGGARPEHLVRLTWYVVDMEEYLANLKSSARSIARSSARIIRRWRWSRSCASLKRRRGSRSRRPRWCRAKLHLAGELHDRESAVPRPRCRQGRGQSRAAEL